MAAVSIDQHKQNFLKAQPHSVSNNYAWIHHACMTKLDLVFKRDFINELVSIINSMSATFVEYGINKKPYITIAMKTMQALVANAGINFSLGDFYDDAKKDLNEIINRVIRFFQEIEKDAGGYESMCSAIEKDAGEGVKFLEESEQSAFKEQMASYFSRIYDLFRCQDSADIVTSDSKSKGPTRSIQQYITENFVSFGACIKKICPGILTAINGFMEKQTDDDLIRELMEINVSTNGLFGAVVKWKENTPLNTGKIRDAFSKLLTAMRKIDDGHKDLKFFDAMPKDFVSIVRSVNDSAKTSKGPNGATSSSDPWLRKMRFTKKRVVDDGGDEASQVDGKKQKTLRDMDSMTKYREAHKKAFSNYRDVVESNDGGDDMFVVADAHVEKYVNDLFDELEFPENLREHVVQKPGFKEMTECLDDDEDPSRWKYDSYRISKEVTSDVFAAQSDILCPTNYALRLGNGFYGDNSQYHLIYVYMNMTDPTKPVPVGVSPVRAIKDTKDGKEQIRINPISQLIRMAKNKVNDGVLPLSASDIKKRREPKKTTKEDNANIAIEHDIFEKHIIDNQSAMTVLKQLQPTLKPEEIDTEIRNIFKAFVTKHFTAYGKDVNKQRKGMGLVFGRLLNQDELAEDWESPDSEYELSGFLAKSHHLIQFTKDKKKTLYLYPTNWYTLRRFDTNIKKPSIKPKMYQIYLVYDDDEGKVLNTKDGSGKYGCFGFIESANVFRTIHSTKDLDEATATLLKVGYPVNELPAKSQKKFDADHDDSPFVGMSIDEWNVEEASICRGNAVGGKGITKMIGKGYGGGASSSSQPPVKKAPPKPKVAAKDDDDFLGDDF